MASKSFLWGLAWCCTCSAKPIIACRGVRISWLMLARKDRKSTRLNSSHANISYAVFCLKKKALSALSVRYRLCGDDCRLLDSYAFALLVALLHALQSASRFLDVRLSSDAPLASILQTLV